MDWWRSERSRNGGVDEIPLPLARGRLWLCGKHYVGPDPEAALEGLGADTVVCLNEEGEFAARYPDYAGWLTENAPGRAVWFPIHDLHAPSAAAAGPFIDDLGGRLERGAGLLMHCGAGVGRAGTIAAALLIALGVPMADALVTVAANRPSAGPQAPAQTELLVALSASRPTRPST